MFLVSCQEDSKLSREDWRQTASAVEWCGFCSEWYIIELELELELELVRIQSVDDARVSPTNFYSTVCKDF